MTSYIDACPPTGNGHRVTLLGTDLIFGGIENVFVYPSLDVHRLQTALSQTLSSWPVLTGRIIVDNDKDEYFIECSDNSIPFTYIENDQLECWPDLSVVVDDATKLQPFIDSVQYKPEIEPLLRIKLTRLLHSNEYILGTSFSHMVGDANTNLHFLNDLSRIYQHLQPLLPRPIFERYLLKKEDSDSSLPLIKYISQNAEKREDIIARIIKEQTETEPVIMSFSSEQLAQLRLLTKNDDNEITTHDTLCAYIILTMNKHLFSTTDQYIKRTNMLVNYRGVSDTITPKGHAANSFIQTLSSDFPNPLCLSSIAKTIRQAIKAVRNEDFLKAWLSQADVLTKQLIKEGRLTFIWNKIDMILNSNFKYDWSNEVNFGMNNQCRLHTVGTYNFYFRIFHLNPVKNEDGSWTKDNGGAEISFRIPKGEGKEKFLNTWKKDVEENFANVKELNK
jgi:hypothetical protein